VPSQYSPQQMVWKRLRLFRRARACRNISQACREFGVSRKTYTTNGGSDCNRLGEPTRRCGIAPASPAPTPVMPPRSSSGSSAASIAASRW